MKRWMRAVASLSFLTLTMPGAAAPPACRIGYTSPRSYDRGIALRVAVATGDFDGDGLIDIVSLHRFVNEGIPNGTGTILLNRGHLAFEQKPLIAAGDFGTVAVRDLNNDGRLDLVLGGSASVAILYGNGDGTFRSGGTAEVHNVTAIAIGQFDGVNGLDIAAAQSSPASLAILLANPDGTYSNTSTVVLAKPPSAVASADFDGDGRADLVTADAQTITPMYGDGSGSFSPGPGLTSLVTLSLATGDLNRDGHPDIIAGGRQVVTTFTYSGSRQFALSHLHPTPQDAATVTLTDVDRDPFPDIVIAGTGDISVLRGAAGGTFLAPVTYVGGANAIGGAAGDFDADGFIDVVVANNSSTDISILRNLGGGVLDAMRKLEAGSHPVFVAPDVNADGVRDLVVANQDSADVLVFINGDSGFSGPAAYGLGFAARSLKTGDIDGDGNPDVVALSVDGLTVGVLFGSPTGVFHNFTTLSFSHPLCCIELADMNLDSRADLVYAEEQGTLGVQLSAGFTFGAAATYPLPSPVTAIAVGDLDNDLLPDVAAATLQEVRTFNGAPFGTLTPRATIDVQDTHALAIARIDSDSFPDIVAGTTDLTILYGNSTQTYVSRGHFGLPSDGITSISIADLDTDGRVDVAATLTRTKTSEHFAVVYMNRGFGLEPQPAIQTETAPMAILAANVTRDDNLPDLIISAADKVLIASSRCAPPSVTAGIASPRAPQPGQPITFVANATAGAGRDATFSFVIDGFVVPGTTTSILEPGVARVTVALPAGVHTVYATVRYPESDGVPSDVVTFTVGGQPGRRRIVRH